jgi:FAD/FMN-containing dehydrogenase
MRNAAPDVVNFGRNARFCPTVRLEPGSEQELLERMRQYRGRRMRAIGRLHSWSEAALTDDVLVDLRHLDQVRIERRGEETWAIVGAGCQIKRALAELERQAGVTLPTLGLIDEQTLAGAIATGTHGSGRHSLSHYMDAIRIAAYDPDTGEPAIREVSAGAELRAVRCSLGCLGIVVSMAFRCRPQYLVEEHARRYETLEEVLAAEDEYPLQQFFLIPWLWRFYGQHRREAAGPRSRLATCYRWYWWLGMDLGFHLLLRFLVRTLRSPAAVRWYYRRVVPRVVICGWKVVDRSQAMLVMEHELFCHIEIEVFVSRSRLPPAVEFVQQVLQVFDGDEAALDEATRQSLSRHGLLADLLDNRGRYTHHYPICIRRVLPDDTLLSMASGGEEPWYAISFISYARPDEREGFIRFARFLARSMAALFGGRPHWGKVCPLGAEEVAALYPRLAEFREVCRQFDPQGRFRNAWVNELLFP